MGCSTNILNCLTVYCEAKLYAESSLSTYEHHSDKGDGGNGRGGIGDGNQAGKGRGRRSGEVLTR